MKLLDGFKGNYSNSDFDESLHPLRGQAASGKLLLIYMCTFHVLTNLLLIYICKLHWNLNTMFVCQVISL
jgi:hypothetical protein